MKIDSHALENIFTPGLTKIFDEFERFGFEIRIVGGAIRDMLLGETPRDVDLAVNATPTEIIFILDTLAKTRDAVVVPGMRHGTAIIALDENEQYEISALDFSITVKDHKIIISQDANWNNDAHKRDFTVNSMSMTRDGKVFDPLGGQKDLKEQRIKFVNDQQQEINRNPIMIMRFFKLLAKFKNPKFDKSYLEVLQNNLDLLSEVRSDALKWFIVNIKNQPYGERSIKMMEDVGIVVSELVESKSLLNMYLQKIYI